VDVTFDDDGRAADVVPTVSDVTLIETASNHAAHDHTDLLGG
jgi:hypothetical protein